MGALAGVRVADLFAFYLGVPEGTVLPETMEIDFDANIRSLWERKIERVRRRSPSWVENTERARDVFSRLYTQAENKESQTINQFIEQANAAVAIVNQNLDWEKLNTIDFEGAHFGKLTDNDIDLIRRLSGNVTGRMLLAYSITELMPSLRNYELNVNFYKFLLENAGANYLRCIPALYDNYLSVGLFQFTSFALYDMGNEKRGASLINTLLPQAEKIPTSVVRTLTNEDQMKAAYLFAIENITRLVLGIRADNNAPLRYIASAHHAPADARAAFRSWIDADFEGSHADLARASIADYIRKSHGNYYELAGL
jgi:hypothetical protein